MRALLIVPPFGGIDRPAIGVHTLQAVGRANRHSVDVLYTNLAFAHFIGEISYLTITEWPALDLLGERIMGLSFGSLLPPKMLAALNKKIESQSEDRACEWKSLSLNSIREVTEAWLSEVTSWIQHNDYDVVGFSTTFEQTNGVRVLARLCQAIQPEAKLIVGGANCEAQMAAAIRGLIPEIEVVFSGESETAFASFLNNPDFFRHHTIIGSPPNHDLNSIPAPDYSEYFAQLDRFLPDSLVRKFGICQLPYESSRGCWWGQKHHCTFCGLNGSGMGYREKTATKVKTEIEKLASSTGVPKICMTDNIMPFSYFKSLVPALGDSLVSLDIFYEQKANLSLDKVIALKRGGISRIQPGIEALSDYLLTLMKKGTSAHQNIALLRYGRSVGVDLAWNLLSGFPDEKVEWYEETLSLIPMISHLQPPTGLGTLSIDRFSPYFENAAEYGITNLRPHSSYSDAFPHFDGLDQLAYHFVGDSSGLTVTNCDTLRRLKLAVDAWRSEWNSLQRTLPILEVVDLGSDNYLLIDTRNLPGTKALQNITEQQASAALTLQPTPTDAVQWGVDSDAVQWGVDCKVCVPAPIGLIPLACAHPATIKLFEQKQAEAKRQLVIA